MKKFLAVVKREYIQRVRAKMFIVSTVLLPAVMSLFGIVPAIIFSIQTPPLRVAVVDQTGKMYAELKQSLDERLIRSGLAIRQCQPCRVVFRAEASALSTWRK